MARFVLLEHDTTQPCCPPPPDRDVHWDLIVEAPGQERHPTWRLLRDPLVERGEIAAERIQDHRSLYLTYEGEISGGRGFVRQVAAGDIDVLRLAEGELVAAFAGQRLRGRYEIRRGRGGRLVFRPAYQT